MQPTGVLETSKATNPLKALLSYGQSMWLDYIRRDLFTSGKPEDDDRGRRSSRDDFESVDLREGDRRKFALRRHVEVAGFASDLDATARYEQIAIRDIQDAADMLSPVYESSKYQGWIRQPGGFSLCSR